MPNSGGEMWQALKRMMPMRARYAYRRGRSFLGRRRYSGMTSRDIFAEIYSAGLWGGTQDGDFYSGVGSHDPALTGPYVASVSDWLKSIGTPDVVDLGCGDFAIGSQLRPYCGHFIAADIVPPLIERNRQRFASLDVDFAL